MLVESLMHWLIIEPLTLSKNLGHLIDLWLRLAIRILRLEHDSVDDLAFPAYWTLQLASIPGRNFSLALVADELELRVQKLWEPLLVLNPGLVVVLAMHAWCGHR